MTALNDVSVEDIRSVLIDNLSDALQIAPTELSTDRPLKEYGADSVVALTVFAALEHTYDCLDLPSTLLRECQTIDALLPVLWSIITGGHDDAALGDAP